VASALFAAHPDGDGVSNLPEYVPGGKTRAADYLFILCRSDLSEAGSSVVVQHFADVTAWKDVHIGATSSDAVNVRQNTPSADMDTITVTIANPGAMTCFVRLRATAL
jgi:hypothetical protein